MKNYEDLNFEETNNLRRHLIEKQDFVSLIELTEYKIKTGSIGLTQYYLPQLFYFYGRARINPEKFQVFLKDNPFIIMSAENSTKELSSKLFEIGAKFPYLNEKEMSFLDKKYTDTTTFELMDGIMHDTHLLPRELKKLDKNKFNDKNTEFTKSFINEIYDCFLANAKVNPNYDKLYVYSSYSDEIIQKKYDDLGYGEICIIDPIHTNDFWTILNTMTNKATADHILNKIANLFNVSLEEIKDKDYYTLSINEVEKHINNELATKEEKKGVRESIAQLWLERVNNDS